MHILRCFFFAAFSLLMVGSGPAFAESTGWFNGKDLGKVFFQFYRKNMRPERVECHDSGSRGFDASAGVAKVEFVPNKPRRAWYGVGTTNFTLTDKRYRRAGYRLVSSDSFVRHKSGLKVYCLIYQKDLK